MEKNQKPIEPTQPHHRRRNRSKAINYVHKRSCNSTSGSPASSRFLEAEIGFASRRSRSRVGRRQRLLEMEGKV
ncbi:hypothetical protein HN51_011844 [Arachis hypogaea]